MKYDGVQGEVYSDSGYGNNESDREFIAVLITFTGRQLILTESWKQDILATSSLEVDIMITVYSLGILLNVFALIYTC